jgi:hypothetical protein
VATNIACDLFARNPPSHGHSSARQSRNTAPYRGARVSVRAGLCLQVKRNNAHRCISLIYRLLLLIAERKRNENGTTRKVAAEHRVELPPHHRPRLIFDKSE